MPAGGQRPKPLLMKHLHGSTQPRNLDEPIPEGALVDNPSECPPHFTAEQREVWEYALRHSPPRLLKRIDGSVLEVWVIAHCLHRQATRDLVGRPLLHEQGHQMIPSPLLSIINKQAIIMMRAAGELGFSPTARPRIFANGPAIGASLNSAAHAQPKDAPRQSLQSYLANSPNTAPVN